MNFKIFLQNQLNEHIIDLTEYKNEITLLDLNHLLKIVQENVQIGYVLFKPDQYNQSDINEIREQIENQSAENNTQFESFTDDSTICLLTNLTYHNIYDLNNFEQNTIKPNLDNELSNHLKTINQKWLMLKKEGWILEKKYQLSENYAYLFINDKLKQAVVSFVSVQLKVVEFYSPEKNCEKIFNLMLDSVISIEILNEILKPYERYYFSFCGYSLGALLAEQSVILSQKYKSRFTIKVKSTTFDSPGSFELLAYLCRNFNISITLNALKSLDIVTYISRPNLINSFDNHIGKIKYLYKNEADKEEIDNIDNSSFFDSLTNESLIYFYDALNDNNTSITTLVDYKYRNNMNILEDFKKMITAMCDPSNELIDNKYTYIFQNIINYITDNSKKNYRYDLTTKSYIKQEPVDPRNYKNKFSLDQHARESNTNAIEYCLNEIACLLKMNFYKKIEFISLFKQLSELENSMEGIPSIKHKLERLKQIKQLLEQNRQIDNVVYLNLIRENLNLKDELLNLSNEKDEKIKYDKIGKIIDSCYFRFDTCPEKYADDSNLEDFNHNDIKSNTCFNTCLKCLCFKNS